MQRSTPVTVAAILNAIMSLANIVFSIPVLAMGADAANAQAAVNNPPFFIVLLGLSLGVAGLVGSWGLWQNQKWARILVIVINVLGGISALPGLTLAQTTLLRLSAIVGVAVSLVIVVLLLWRSRPEVAGVTPR